MKKASSHLQGFTLIELMASMALIAVVIVLGGFMYQIFHRYQQNYNQEVTIAYDQALLQKQIQSDVWNAYTFSFSDQYLILENRKAEPIYRYLLTDSILLRERISEGQIDSLAFQGIWQFPPQLDGFQLIDTASRLPFTFTLLPKSRVRNAIPISAN